MVNNTYRAKLARRIEDYICKLLIDNLSYPVMDKENIL